MNLVPIVAALAAGALAATAATAQPAHVRQMRVSEHNGVLRTTELLKTGKRMETISCADFNALDTSFQPQAVAYAANYGPKGVPHPTYTVSGLEKFTPVVVQDCRARPGDHLVSTVHTDMANMKM